MKELPILYSTPMIQAKLAKLKTQTRRLKGLENVNSHQGKPLRLIGDSRICDHPRPAIKYDDRLWFWWTEGNGTFDKLIAVRCPYKPGDVLWARETWCSVSRADCVGGVTTKYHYKADLEDTFKWKPSIHMPKSAARIWERITDIRVERLQDISEEDAIAEGIKPLMMSRMQYAEFGQLYCDYSQKEGIFNDGKHPIDSYRSLWESINGLGSWGINPWVWAITTEIISTTGIQNAGLAVSKTETKN